MVWYLQCLLTKVLPYGGLQLVDCHRVTATPKPQLPSFSLLSWVERRLHYDRVKVTEEVSQPNSFAWDRSDHH